MTTTFVTDAEGTTTESGPRYPHETRLGIHERVQKALLILSGALVAAEMAAVSLFTQGYSIIALVGGVEIAFLLGVAWLIAKGFLSFWMLKGLFVK